MWWQGKMVPWRADPESDEAMSVWQSLPFPDFETPWSFHDGAGPSTQPEPEPPRLSDPSLLLGAGTPASAAERGRENTERGRCSCNARSAECSETQLGWVKFPSPSKVK